MAYNPDRYENQTGGGADVLDSLKPFDLHTASYSDRSQVTMRRASKGIKQLRLKCPTMQITV